MKSFLGRFATTRDFFKLIVWAVAGVFTLGIVWASLKTIPERVERLESRVSECEKVDAVFMAKLDLIIEYLKKR